MGTTVKYAVLVKLPGQDRAFLNPAGKVTSCVHTAARFETEEGARFLALLFQADLNAYQMQRYSIGVVEVAQTPKRRT